MKKYQGDHKKKN